PPHSSLHGWPNVPGMRIPRRWRLLALSFGVESATVCVSPSLRNHFVLSFQIDTATTEVSVSTDARKFQEDTLVALLGKLAARQPKARVLSVSYDEALRCTRQLLLEAQGYEVISTDRLESTLEQCKLGGFDLFVLGHSIPQEDKQRMVEAFRQYCSVP